MVRFRGISISIVSQVDAKRLPEHSTARAFEARGTAVACYVPVLPGAQIWLEYSIDGPHPLDAAYFFKMLINDQVISSWHCTSKHDYHGKATYILQTVTSQHSNEKVVLQKSLAFTGMNGIHSPAPKNDRIEIRIYRIEHRRRIRDLPLDMLPAKHSPCPTALRLIDSGPIDFARPARRYQYQLVDPQDEPYATFRFYCRTQEYLRRHQILDFDTTLSPTSVATSASNYYDAISSPVKRYQEFETTVDKTLFATPTRRSMHRASPEISNTTLGLPRSPRSSRRAQFPHEISKLNTKDSIEGLQSTVPRSPQSLRKLTFSASSRDTPESPTKESSPLLPDSLQIRKQRSSISALNISTLPVFYSSYESSARPTPRDNLLKASSTMHSQPSSGSAMHVLRPPHKLTDLDLMLDGTTTTQEIIFERRCESSQDHQHRRPLSPFTPGGFLRRLTSTPIFSSRSTSVSSRFRNASCKTPEEAEYSYPNQSATYRVEVLAERAKDWTPLRQRRSGRELLSNILGRSGVAKRNMTA